jgi:hypothetical protein
VSSIRKQIVDAAIALINTAPPMGVPTVDDGRLEPYAQPELPAITVYELREEGELAEQNGRWSYFLRRTFTMRVEIRIAETTAIAARAAVDPLYVWLGQNLGGNQFGGLAEDSYETLLEWQHAAEDQAYTLLQVDFRITYTTMKIDPSRLV